MPFQPRFDGNGSQGASGAVRVPAIEPIGPTPRTECPQEGAADAGIERPRRSSGAFQAEIPVAEAAIVVSVVEGPTPGASEPASRPEPTLIRLTIRSLAALSLAATPFASTPQASGPDVDFARDVRPILARRCFECHGPDKQKGSLRLDVRDSLFRGPDPDFPPVVPGDLEASGLFERVTLPADDPDVMPAKGEPLSVDEIEVLRKWITAGAPAPASAFTPVSETGAAGLPPASPERIAEALAALDDAGGPVDFNRDVRPILAANCFQCHGHDPEHRKAGLRLDTYEGAFAEGDGATALIVPGDAARSILVHRILAADEDDRMPPADSGRELDERERGLLVRWIVDGAKWEEHWSFIAPEVPPLPEVEGEHWPRGAIDRFILARLEAEGLAPSAETDRRSLIRRVTLDLTGLPPTLEEVESFVARDDPDAYERLVDRLLDSPRYGEHMARYWLDAARYGDTHGLHLDNYREMWPYRDWVIDAFNANKPYDEFAVEQIAGDLLPDASLAQRIASGFNRAHVSTNEGGSISEEVYVRNVVDRVSTTGTVFLGLTVGCAVCHDHKFDPVTQKEFYQLFAFFNNLDANPMDGNAKAHPPVAKVPSEAQTTRMAALRGDIADEEAVIAVELAKVVYVEPDEMHATADAPRREIVWVDDELPAGAEPEGDGLVWQESPARLVHSGRLSMKRTSVGLQQHSFRNAAKKLRIGYGDTLFAWIYLDPAAPPREVMLQYNTDGAGAWGHRAYWGENLIEYGKDGTTERVRMGELPPAGEWVRLEVDVAQVGLVPGMVVHGMAFTQFDGTAYWDTVGIDSAMPEEPEDFAWIHDDVPSGAKLAGNGATWRWVGGAEHPVKSGLRSLRRSGGDGLNQDYFTEARPLRLHTGDVLYAHVWLDPDDPPRSVQLQFNDGGWGHRARWGAPAHGAGADGGADFVAGDLPPTGEWVRLAVDLASVGLKQGSELNGWAFTQVGGTVYWDEAGVRTWSPPDDRYLQSQRIWERIAAGDKGVPQDVRDALAIDREARDAAPAKLVRDHYLRYVYGGTRQVFDGLEGRVTALRDELKQVDDAVPTTLVMKELAEPRPAYLLLRGDYEARGEEVVRATPAVLPAMDPDLPRDRLGFARWLVDPGHPLTARVAVNRLWQQVFGTGIVKTAEDFGNQGERPSHPSLLDWLATRFVADGWDVKGTMRRLVLSSTYRQSSRVTPELNARDPENRLYARGPRFRLDAEVLRDQALFVSGLLVETLGGPSVKPPQPAGLWHAVGYTSSNTARFEADEGPDKVYRRSLYTFLKRTSPPPQMTTFDAPSRETSCVRRERTNTPLQALLLMNEQEYVEAARGLALRTLNSAETAPDRARYAFRLGTGRDPDEGEVGAILELFEGALAEYRSNPAAALALLGADESDNDPERDAAELAAWTMVANLILNLDEVITKS
ncbi:MAG: DUF1553 domain-containing protein [Planctomycetota bacterium]|nr:MAG: DUF1553 domain-containing protein [Planctomycetota bacterium]